MSRSKVKTPHFPSYSKAREFLKLLECTPKAVVSGMLKSIHDQTGTPQDQMDWSNPEEWVPKFLKGAEAQFAKRLWVEASPPVNPRHVRGAYYLIQNFDLADADSKGILHLTARGHAFVQSKAEIVREIDTTEGLIRILQILASKASAQMKHLVGEWAAFLQTNSNYRSDSVYKSTLYARLRNLVERGLVTREGLEYAISPAGLEYVGRTSDDPTRDLVNSAKVFNAKQRDALRDRLSKLDPYRFEKLIAELLEAMGYDDVEVTKASGDKGVDVTAKIQFGITTVPEFIQVKRIQANIQRPTLDQLRGVLPLHNALRGTLITLSDFSDGCKIAAFFPGAAPITLINGEKLLDLLIQHEIGMKPRMIPIYELDEEFFSQTSDAEIAEAAGSSGE